MEEYNSGYTYCGDSIKFPPPTYKMIDSKEIVLESTISNSEQLPDYLSEEISPINLGPLDDEFNESSTNSIKLSVKCENRCEANERERDIVLSLFIGLLEFFAWEFHNVLRN